MKEKKQKTLRTNWKRTSFLMFILLAAMSFGAMHWYQQLMGKQQQVKDDAEQSQVAKAIHADINQAIKGWSNQLKLISKQVNQLALFDRIEEQRSQWQDTTLSVLSDVQKLCLIERIPGNPTKTPCLDINFATLDMLRRAEKGMETNAVYIKTEQQAYLLFVEQVKNSSDRFSGVIALAVDPAALTRLIQNVVPKSGYIELTQGVKK